MSDTSAFYITDIIFSNLFLSNNLTIFLFQIKEILSNPDAFVTAAAPAAASSGAATAEAVEEKEEEKEESDEDMGFGLFE